MLAVRKMESETMHLFLFLSIGHWGNDWLRFSCFLFTNLPDCETLLLFPIPTQVLSSREGFDSLPHKFFWHFFLID